MVIDKKEFFIRVLAKSIESVKQSDIPELIKKAAVSQREQLIKDLKQESK